MPDTDSSQQQDSSSDWTSGKPLGSGPFDQGLHDTPRTAWIAVLLMVGGFALVGVMVVLLSISMMPAIIVGIVGGVLGLIGIIVAITSNVMSNVE